MLSLHKAAGFLLEGLGLCGAYRTAAAAAAAAAGITFSARGEET